MRKFNYKNLINSKLLRATGIYSISSIINSAIPFFLLPIMTRYLSPNDYGIVSMYGVLLSFLMPFVGVSVHGAISRMYFERDVIKFEEYLYNCLLILCASTLIILMITLFFYKPIAQIFSIPTQLIWIAVIISFSQFITNVVLILWQVQLKPIYYGIYQISQTIIIMLLSLVLVVIFGMNWRGRVYAQLITLIIYSIIGIYIISKNKWLSFNFNYEYIKHALHFGVPLIPHLLGGAIMTMIDRIFITRMVGIETTGIYTVGYQIGMIINILATAFNQAYIPWLYSKLKENLETVKYKIVKFTYLYFALILFLAFLLSFISPKLLDIFIGKKYNESNIFIAWVAVGYAFNGMYLMVTNYVFYAQKTKYLSWITLIGSFLNIGLNYILIKKNGAIGAAQATTIIYTVKFILTWIYSSSVYRMPWRLRKKQFD